MQPRKCPGESFIIGSRNRGLRPAPHISIEEGILKWACLLDYLLLDLGLVLSSTAICLGMFGVLGIFSFEKFISKCG